MAWLEVFAGLFGEHLPHKDQIRLPMFDKRTVWQAYEFDMRGEGKRSIAYATFVKAWSEKMTYIKTQRRAKIFEKCSLCAKFSASSLSQVLLTRAIFYAIWCNHRTFRLMKRGG